MRFARRPGPLPRRYCASCPASWDGPCLLLQRGMHRGEGEGRDGSVAGRLHSYDTTLLNGNVTWRRGEREGSTALRCAANLNISNSNLRTCERWDPTRPWRACPSPSPRPGHQPQPTSRSSERPRPMGSGPVHAARRATPALWAVLGCVRASVRARVRFHAHLYPRCRPGSSAADTHRHVHFKSPSLLPTARRCSGQHTATAPARMAWHRMAWHGMAWRRVASQALPGHEGEPRPARRCAAANTSPAALLGTHAHWNGCPWLVYDRSPRTLPPCDPERRDPRPVSGPASGLRLRQGLASATLFPRGNAALPHSAANVAVYE